MDKKYCSIHGTYWGDGCRDCQRAEERAERDHEEAERNAREREEAAQKREEAAERREEAREQAARNLELSYKLAAGERAYRETNPGEYECPACLYITLKRGAGRCPKCQKDIDRGYWSKVFAKEEADRKAYEAAIEAERIRVEEEQRRHQAWLASPDGRAHTKAEQQKLEAQQKAEQRKLAAEQKASRRKVAAWRSSEKAQGIGDKALLLATWGWLLFPLATLGFLMGIWSIYRYMRGSSLGGAWKAVAALVIGFLPGWVFVWSLMPPSTSVTYSVFSMTK